MAEPNTSTVDLLQRLVVDPHNLDLLNRAAAELRSNPIRFAQSTASLDLATNRNISKLSAVEDDVDLKKGKLSWSNSLGNQIATPAAILRPQSRQDLVDAILHAQETGQTVRAVGSGHSFSDVALTDGLLLDPHGMNRVIPLDPSLLRDPTSAARLFAVESGITIKDLNLALDQVGLALLNMGAYDGQTLAGAISTGTHGTGIALGPLCSSVRSLVLVSESGTVYQIEPSQGITDPVVFANRYPDIVLKQDDDWFHSNAVAMGCTGLIYAYTLEVTKAYHLAENRKATTWEELKLQWIDVLPGELPSVLTANRHYEIDVNPYAVDGVHNCIVTTRNIHSGLASGSRGFGNWLGGLLAQVPIAQQALVALVNHIPALIPHVIDAALNTLPHSGYVDKSYKVFNLGDANKASAYAIELSFPAHTFVRSVDRLLELLQEFVVSHGYHQTGPIGVRFVAAAEAYLAPQNGRDTCMTELIVLDGIENGMALLNSIQKRMTEGNSEVRVHWGLELGELQGSEAARMYREYGLWLTVYRQLNSTGIFNAQFTERMGISTVNPNT